MFYEDVIQREIKHILGKKPSCHSLSALSPQPKGEESEVTHVNVLLPQGASSKLQNCNQYQQQ